MGPVELLLPGAADVELMPWPAAEGAEEAELAFAHFAALDTSVPAGGRLHGIRFEGAVVVGGGWCGSGPLRSLPFHLPFTQPIKPSH